MINTGSLRVIYLEEESACELILQPVEDFTNICDRAAVDTIIHLTRCGGGDFWEMWRSLKDSDRNLLQSLVYKEAIAHQDTMILQTTEDG
ncbi:hypothetical protein NDI49_26950 [Trichocoleus sp. ST-U3]|uniref:hypothetical protein n=1 Tax=Coleofasciculus sp. FACHB-542 TaxID=2692787 RepID=UPI001685E8A2|nr:hypothetical protein [Coleofasciculus sp. FACHB-542]